MLNVCVVEERHNILHGGGRIPLLCVPVMDLRSGLESQETSDRATIPGESGPGRTRNHWGRRLNVNRRTPNPVLLDEPNHLRQITLGRASGSLTETGAPACPCH